MLGQCTYVVSGQQKTSTCGSPCVASIENLRESLILKDCGNKEPTLVDVNDENTTTCTLFYFKHLVYQNSNSPSLSAQNQYGNRQPK